MGYIYKYTDLADNRVKYVGIIKSEKNFPRRFQQHQYSDDWCKGRNFKIEYAFIESKSDLEMLEGHFITYYETFNYFNKAKSDWGLSSFPIQVHWKEFIGTRDNSFNDRMVTLYRKLEQLECEISNISKELGSLGTEQTKKRRQSVREFIDTNYKFGLYEYYKSEQTRLSFDEVYEDYDDFCISNQYDPYTSCDYYEFFEDVSSIFHLYVKVDFENRHVLGLMRKD